MRGFDPTRLDMVLEINEENRQRQMMEGLSVGVSRLDLEAPSAARKECAKGTQVLMQKRFAGAVEHLTKATSTYRKFVSAHNALGSAYLVPEPGLHCGDHDG
jgi:Flp pilus assembly protein TadD